MGGPVRAAQQGPGPGPLERLRLGNGPGPRRDPGLRGDGPVPTANGTLWANGLYYPHAYLEGYAASLAPAA
ncbi:hypothetical protein GCM10010267_66780 [Streptomyces griseorubens]|nr:hypothetical protein GCM10010267_66780 [Streptomyces griseorubens]